MLKITKWAVDPDDVAASIHGTAHGLAVIYVSFLALGSTVLWPGCELANQLQHESSDVRLHAILYIVRLAMLGFAYRALLAYDAYHCTDSAHVLP